MKIRKIASVLVAALLALSALTLCVTADNTPDGTAINNADEFAAMEASGNYYLAADITIAKSYAKTFSGTFNGNGHTVTVSAPMFSNFNGKICNLTIEGKIDVKQESAGAVAANSTVGFYAENVVNNASVAALGMVGGFVGNAMGAELYCCVNNGEISSIGSTAAVGGFLGHPANGASNYDVIIRSCLNTGTITSIYDSGGFIGNMGLANNLPANGGAYLIEKSANLGTVTGGRYAGGFIGYTYASGSNAFVYMRYVTNAGKIIGGKAGTGFMSEFIAYTNSPNTTLTFCVGCGELAFNANAAKATTYVCLFGCSSADTTKCGITGVYLADNNVTEWYTYATADTNSANRRALSTMCSQDRVIKTTAEKIADGTVVKNINYLTASDAFVQEDGIPMPKVLVEYLHAKDEPPVVTTEEESTAAEPETTVSGETSAPAEEKKGCKSSVCAAAVVLAVAGAAVVFRKKF